MNELRERINEASTRAGLSIRQLAGLMKCPELVPMMDGRMKLILLNTELLAIAEITDSFIPWLETGVERELDADTAEAISKIAEPDRSVLAQLFTRCGWSQ